MTEARELFDYRPAAEAKRGRRLPERLRLAEAPAPKTPKPNATTVRLVRDGWDFEVRMGRRIWRHEEVFGGAFYGEEMAVRINDERKGS